MCVHLCAAPCKLPHRLYLRLIRNGDSMTCAAEGKTESECACGKKQECVVVFSLISLTCHTPTRKPASHPPPPHPPTGVRVGRVGVCFYCKCDFVLSPRAQRQRGCVRSQETARQDLLSTLSLSIRIFFF